MKSKDNNKDQGIQNIKEMLIDNTKKVVVDSIMAENMSIIEFNMPKYFFDDLKRAIEYEQINRVKEILKHTNQEMLRYWLSSHGDYSYNILHYIAATGNLDILDYFCHFYKESLSEFLKELLEEKNESNMTPNDLAYYNRHDNFCEELTKLLGVDNSETSP